MSRAGRLASETKRRRRATGAPRFFWAPWRTDRTDRNCIGGHGWVIGGIDGKQSLSSLIYPKRTGFLVKRHRRVLTLHPRAKQNEDTAMIGRLR